MARQGAPRALSARRTRWLLNFFPPWLIQGIRIVELDPAFRRCVVRVRRSRLTANLQGTTFGGTIFCAADPIFAILYWQILAHRGIHAHAWLRGASIRYLAPAATALTLEFALSEDDVARALSAIEREGRYARKHLVEARDASGVVCAVAETEVYLKRAPDDVKDASAF